MSGQGSSSSPSSSPASSSLSVRGLSQQFNYMDIRPRLMSPPTRGSIIRPPPTPPTRPPPRRVIRDKLERLCEHPEIKIGRCLKMPLKKVAKMNPYEVSAPERLVPPPEEPYENGVDTPSTSAPNNSGYGKTKRSGPVEGFGKSCDDERMRHNSEIDNQLNATQYSPPITTIGLPSLAGGSVRSNRKKFARPPIFCCSKGVDCIYN